VVEAVYGFGQHSLREGIENSKIQNGTSRYLPIRREKYIDFHTNLTKAKSQAEGSIIFRSGQKGRSESKDLG
jgi:hypothetical protein